MIAKKKRLKLSFTQLVTAVKRVKDPGLLKLAVDRGWLTDGTFVTRLTEAEQAKIREAFRSDPDVKKAAVVEPRLPAEVGPMAETVKVAGNNVRVTAAGRTATVNGLLWQTMKLRHPQAVAYLGDNCVILSEKSTVAIVPVVAAV